MSDDSEVTRRREALRRRLDERGFWPLPDVLSDSIASALQRITRRRPRPWYCLTILSLSAYLAINLTALIFNEKLAFAPGFILHNAAWVAYVTSFLAIVKLFTDIISRTLRDRILDALDSETDLIDLEEFLTTTSSTKSQLLIITAFGLIYGLTSSYLHSRFSYFHVVILHLYIVFLGAAVVMNVALILALLAKLGSYRFNLYPLDPTNTEIIFDLNGTFTFIAYVLALGSGVTTLLAWLSFFSWSQGHIWIVMTAVFLSWVPLSLYFFFFHYTLKKIINRAKWETLKKVQAQIELLRAREPVPSESTLDNLDKLMNHHDRIRMTKSSTLNMTAFLTYLKTMLIPLLAALLPLLDEIIAFFQP